MLSVYSGIRSPGAQVPPATTNLTSLPSVHPNSNPSTSIAQKSSSLPHNLRGSDPISTALMQHGNKGMGGGGGGGSDDG